MENKTLKTFTQEPKTLRAGERQVWPGNGMKLTAWVGMEPASVFYVEGSGQRIKRAGEMESGRAGQRNAIEGLLLTRGATRLMS
jgi:hypothetical protein